MPKDTAPLGATDAPAPPGDPAPRGAHDLGPGAAALLGAALTAIAHGVGIQGRFLGATRASARVWVELYAASHVLALGAAAAALALAWRRFGPPNLAAKAAALAIASGVAGLSLLEVDASGLAGRAADLTGLPYPALHAAISVLGGWVVPIAFLAGRLIARPWLRWLAVPATTAAAYANATELAYSYEGVHLLAAVAASVLLASALAGARVPARLVVRPHAASRAALGGAALVGAAGLVVPPSNAVLVELARQPAAVLAPFPLFPQDDVEGAWTPPPDVARWYEPSEGPARDPTPGVPWKPDPVVLLLGVDSARADVFAGDEHRASLPHLHRLRDESVSFTEARSPGTSTAPALAALFSGAYYSQLYWVRHPKRPSEPFPHEDERQRFPEALAEAGIPTVTVDSTGWLLNEFGIVRGFTDEQSARRGGAYPDAADVAAPLLQRIAEHRDGPLFLFAHFLDAHGPFKGQGKDPAAFATYIARMGDVDKQLARLRTALIRQRLWSRTVVIVYSDHGEAFGEHGLVAHGQALYEELVRVPLFIRVPGLPARSVDAPVSLIDLGPTVLDVFRLPTPDQNMGESLVPFLLGDDPRLTRPIFGEARLKRALVDGETKIIHDTRMRTVEVYDLSADPREDRNLFSRSDQRSAEGVAKLKRFFDAHTFRRPGYRVPYRRW